MNYKNLLIVVVLVVIVGGLALWLSFREGAPEETEEVEDEIVVLLGDLKKETGIDFSDIKEVEFDWRIIIAEEVELLIVQGKGYEVSDIPEASLTGIKPFFEQKGFEVDFYNVADGTVSGMAGYKKDDIVCIFMEHQHLEEGEVIEDIQELTGQQDVVVQCGKLVMPQTSQEGTIEIKSGDSFSVMLEANPTTGYQWELDFDSVFIQLIDRKYVVDYQGPGSPPPGRGGHETFNFLALEPGETEITFSYLRAWEEDKPPIEKKVYKVIIE